MAIIAQMPCESGIYLIRNLSNDKVYVGASKNIARRIREHFCSLEYKRHYNQSLQSDFDSMGRDSFTVDVIELCDPSFLKSKEEALIAKWQGCSYNIRKEASPNTGQDAAIESRRKISNAIRNRTRKDETRLRASLKQKGIPKTGSIAAGSEHPCAVAFELISPDGVVHKGRSIRNFALKHGLSPSSLREVVTGVRVHHRGWRAVGVENRKHSNNQPYRFLSPGGEVFEGFNVFAFAKQHGLNFSTMNAVRNGHAIHHKGWRNADNPQPMPTHSSKPSAPSRYKFISPCGEVFEGLGVKSFAKQHGLGSTRMRDLHNGMIRSYKGWIKG